MDLGIASYAGIMMICYLVGAIVKISPLNDKFIPVICGCFGAALGALALYLAIPDFPATNIINAVAVGAASGFAATGINQIFKQFSKDTEYPVEQFEEDLEEETFDFNDEGDD